MKRRTLRKMLCLLMCAILVLSVAACDGDTPTRRDDDNTNQNSESDVTPTGAVTPGEPTPTAEATPTGTAEPTPTAATTPTGTEPTTIATATPSAAATATPSYTDADEGRNGYADAVASAGPAAGH